MRVTVCELDNDPSKFAGQWTALAEHTRSEKSEVVLLPEMPFHPWLPSTRNVNPQAWQASIDAHDRWMARLPELGAEIVIATRPTVRDGRRFNQGFVWDAATGVRAAHEKRYLPDEEGFWEASWYARGSGAFTTVPVGRGTLGFAICTDLWFTEHARAYGKQGAHVIVCPRATPAGTVEKWIAGGRVAAVVSGAYCLSSNFSGRNEQHGTWGGTGWIIEPEEGRVLGTTSVETPFLTLEIDPSAADRAKNTYPRYVDDS